MYHLDRRNLAPHVYQQVGSLRKAAAILKVSHTTIRRWMHGFQRAVYRRCSLKRELVEGLVLMTLRESPLSTLRDLQQTVFGACAVSVSKSLVATILQRNGITRKKARFYGHPRDLESRTSAFISDRAAAIVTGKPFYSVDETSFGRNVGATFGYSPRGTKVFIRKRQARCTTSTVVACVGDDGSVRRTSMTGSCNGERFQQFLKDCNFPAGAVVLLDNVSFHRSRSVVSWAHERSIQLLYVPPYSPWFNPIEGCFSIVKRAYYKGLSIDESFRTLTSSHCRAFFGKSLSASERF